MSQVCLKEYGIDARSIRCNLPPSRLIEIALKSEPCRLTDTGALLVETGKYTGRSPNDRFVVDIPAISDRINWGKDNLKLSVQSFDIIYKKITEYLSNKDLFVFDGFAGADRSYGIGVRVINEYASQNLFMNNMLLRPSQDELDSFKADFVIMAAPGLKLDPKECGTNSEAAIVLNLERNMVLICGSKYSGEMKKSVFSVMNYVLPLKNVLSMHCSANAAMDGGNTALFFGLSGTGKTTLSADPKRRLIGDDEHGWSNQGIFNIEGGCYAKCINLSKKNEPQIYGAIRHGALAENVVVNEYGSPDYADQSLTENTRVSYPVDFIEGAVIPGVGSHPDTVVFLSADAFGVLPPISRLTKEQAMYYFVSGYTAKVAGTERGVSEPSATFSTCFGSPFLPLKSEVYATMLGEKIAKHGSEVYLINTGWAGGQYGVGSRMSLPITRALVTAALDGTLKNASYEVEPFFKLSIPRAVPGVDSSLLNPRNAWKNKEDYDATARKLASLFEQNFKKYPDMPSEIINAGPK